ncbi:MAG: cupin domain-containing protein [Acidobacteria bacterium]|nr:cupin domain-containing protein [Acidobacteriota bacterium]
MTVREQQIRLAFTLLCAAATTPCVACHTLPAQGTVAGAPDAAQDTTTEPSRERSRIALSHALPQLDGRRLEVTVVEVTYRPGGASSPHRHPCPVFGYVVEGALRTQVQGEPEVIYQVGESFYEGPNAVHLVSANASQTEPTRFLAYFTCDRDTPLSVAVPTMHR